MPQHTDTEISRAEQLQRAEDGLQDLIRTLAEARGWLQGFRAARAGGAS